MLENIAAQILNRYIGQYVENINKQNLSIGLLKGAVVLEDLPLRKDAFDDLELPGIVLKSGHIGKVVLRIKSYKNFKEPWIIEIHRLRLVVGPGETNRTVDKEQEKKKKEESKRDKLQALEEKWRAKHGQNTSMYSFWYAYSSSIITTIMENLQFEVHDFHIRYEDDKTLPQSFACGIVIKNVTSKSTDEQWKPTSGEQSRTDMMHKLLQLDGFSVYWDEESEMLGDLPLDVQDNKLKKWELSDPASVLSEQRKAGFLLAPVCGEAKLTKNSSPLPLRSKSKPRILLDVLLGEISLHLNHTQYKQAIALASELSRCEKRGIYKTGRPTENIKNDPRSWWRWACGIQLQKVKMMRQRSSKEFVMNRAKKNVEYVRQYERIIRSKMELEKISASELTQLETELLVTESDLTFPEIQILRDVVCERTEQALEQKKAETKRDKARRRSSSRAGGTKGWGSWLRGWGWSAEVQPKDTKQVEEEEAPSPAEMVLHDSMYKDLNEEEIYEMFGEELSEQDTNDTFLKRDSVFLKLIFKLDAGSLTLHEDTVMSEGRKLGCLPFIGIEFRDVATTSEWRPRYKSSQVKTDLGGLYVKDLSNSRSCFGDLIRPRLPQMDNVSHTSQESENIMSSSIKGVIDLLSSNKATGHSRASKTPVFSMLYRNQPRTSQNRFQNRLEIESAPIVITFLPNLVERVKDFFKSTESSDDSVELDDGISAAALEKYNVWKQQSQTEIKRTVKKMMDGKDTANISRDKWAVTLKISAPEIILPEDVFEPRTNVVVANLGHMTFKNHNEDDILASWNDQQEEKSTSSKLEEDEFLDAEEDFVTPPDSPLEEAHMQREDDAFKSAAIEGQNQENMDLYDLPSQQRLNEKLFHERMYEQYQVHFTDLQVLVARNDEKWEATRAQGKGPHHLIERFSVDLLLERRMVQTLDPECPAVKLKGNLPRLTVHVSQDKAHSLFRCLNKIAKPPEASSSKSQHSRANASSTDTSKSDKWRRAFKPVEESLLEEKSLSKLLLIQFAMNEVSVLLEENPASIVSILEVRRIQAEFTKRPFDHTSMFSLHSMLLVDTKQELGHEYELLLASHGNVKMDLGSGNILDSGTTSPLADDRARSASTSEPSPGVQMSSTKNMLSNVAKTLRQSNIFSFAREEPQSPVDPTGSFAEAACLEGGDLITMEWRVTQPGSFLMQGCRVAASTANVKFNSLDLVLNLKTWVALLDFLHHLKPAEDVEYNSLEENIAFEQLRSGENSEDVLKIDLVSDPARNDDHTSLDNASSDTEIFVHFHQLNVLLLRHIDCLDKVRGRKVATLSLHNTKVHVTLDPRGENQFSLTNTEHFETLVSTNGSVGGLVLQDLTNAVRGDGGMQVLCLGDLGDSAPLEVSLRSSFSPNTGEKVHRESFDARKQAPQNEALKFTMTSENRKQRKDAEDRKDTQFEMEGDGGLQCDQVEVVLNISLASVLYMHTPRLVAEVLALVDEAGDVINAKMPTDTKQAYKDMAYSIMDKSIAMLGKSTLQLGDTFDAAGTKSGRIAGEPASLFKLTVDMQSPIVALPKCHGSYELLVGNLGKITVKNGHALGRYRDEEEAMDFLSIAITDMNVCSRRQVEEEKKARKSPGILRRSHMRKTLSGPSLAKLKKSANSRGTAFSEIQILHDTSIRLTVRKEPFILPYRRVLCRRITSVDDGEVYDGPISDKKMCVNVKMTLPLAVTLSKAAYEQVLKTLDHISYGGNIDVDDIEDMDGSIYPANLDEPRSRNINNSMQKRRDIDNTTSQQSTPSHNREFKLFSAPGFEIPPAVNQSQSEASVITNRKYTPLSADVSIPQIAIELTQDFSGGEQGVVKVTLEGFSAQFDKQNRSTTALELTLGSIDIEDLLKDERSPHRHIVSSVSFTSGDDKGKSDHATEYMSTSCPASSPNAGQSEVFMSSSLPALSGSRLKPGVKTDSRSTRTGVFRPYLASGAFGVSQSTHDHQAHRSRNTSKDDRGEEYPFTPPSSPTVNKTLVEDETLVRIKAFLVDGKSAAYRDVYNKTNRKIDVDFNSLDCKVNLQTWVVLLDFFGIGTSPKKSYQLDPKTEEEYNWDRRLAVSSYYENQPDDFINSEIDFKVHSFSLIFNKEEYKFMKANISKFGTHVQIRDGVLGVSGQLGSLSVSDLSPNGTKYREKFVFAGEKAMDFDVKKFDDYDEELRRDYDIKVRLKMSAICYVHTHRFHQELVAYLQHFQQLQEVLGRMRAASVGQEVLSQSRRQARILLDIEADSPVLLIPESSHSDRLVVADLGNLTVKNSFKWNGDPGTLSQDKDMQQAKQVNPDASGLLSPNSRSCLLDVLHANLDQMDLYTAARSDVKRPGHKSYCDDDSDVLAFSTFLVKRDEKPLLREKCKLYLQIERNLEKETMVRNVPDTSVSGQLSSVYCTVDLQQYWLVRGILDHNLGEPIPEFPQPTAFLQPSSIQTILSGSVYTGMSIDMHLLNVSVELLKQHKTAVQNEVSLARLGYVKSWLSYRSFSDQTKTVNLSCEAFVASDTRWGDDDTAQQGEESRRNVFSTILGPTHRAKVEPHRTKDSLLQFELHYREGPDFLHFTALLVDMRVYIISDWLADVHRYLIVNPAQEWCDSLRAKAAQLLKKYNQVVPGQGIQKQVAVRDEQFKVNVTNTDFVLMENPSCIDSDAVILRITAMLHYNPNILKLRKHQTHRKLLNCTLQSLEVFSCQLDIENETELSIVDPTKVNIEIDAAKQTDLTQDEIVFDPSLLDKNKVDVQVLDLNMRVSYNDLLLFLAITKSLSSDKKDESAGIVDSSSHTNMECKFHPPEKDVENLMQLSYSREDVLKALEEEDGNIQQAGEWLLENATVLSEEEMQRLQGGEKQEVPLNIGKIFLAVNSMCVCLIDDCADCDVPLAEFAMKSFSVEQNLSLTDPKKVGKVTTSYAGKANFVLSGDYYNRMLSLWEPYLEPWRCCLKWNYAPGATLSSIGRWDVKVQTSDRLDITITSTLFETMKKTKESWTRSFNRSSDQSVDLIDLGPSCTDRSSPRKRKEFVPYILRNLTGLPLMFMTYASALEKPSTSGFKGKNPKSSAKNDETWISVNPGDSHPFRFDRAEKQRHKRSEQIILHRIITKVGNWETLSPVTISQVGVYFRHAAEEIVKSSAVYRAPDPIRVVFAVTLERSAQKVVTVRSALVVRSKVKIPIQLHLVHNVEKPIVLPRIDPGGVQYIPLQLTDYGIKIRPVFSSKTLYRPSTQAIRWELVDKDAISTSDIITCPAETYKDDVPFRFSVCIKRKSYPTYEEVSERMANDLHPRRHNDIDETTKYGYVPPHMPGHTIVILPPVVVSNLLPCDLHYYFKDTSVAGKLSPGQDATLHILKLVPGSIDHRPLILGCGLEGFKECRELTITHVEKNAQMRMVMFDHQGRPLILNVRVFWRLGCSVKLSVMSGYWIVNKTGLPIVIKQDGALTSFAGQYLEHERARSLTPLLFSYSDRELPYLCTMRLGKESTQEMSLDQLSKYPHATSRTPYCQSFSIDGGTCTRNLSMENCDNSPCRVYYIGVGVRRGWGRYLHTHIVTLAPRFLLINMTKERTLSFAQLHATSFTTDAAGLNRHLTIKAGSSVIFHWPRADLDLLLCTRLTKQSDCRWSGGFVIDRIDAFHVHLRIFGGVKGNHSVFLRVEITLVDATYRVMFFDGDVSSCPSPLRIDNISAAPLVIRQRDTDEGLQIDVPPSSQIPYACDEPCLPPFINCRVQGASVSSHLNMDNIGEERVLYYENFIYIVVGQQPTDLYSRHGAVDTDDLLVLAAQEVHYDQPVDGTGHLVTVERRETGKRSQLWTMTIEGFLRHEGSSPPGSISKYPSSKPQGLVLDIAELLMSTNIMPLTIRRIDPTRKSQFWDFKEDGRLCCGFKNLCVQLSPSKQVGLAPYVLGGLATPNQCCRSEKMIAGSGVLSLKVVRDGPTRVIRVMDIKQKRAGVARDTGGWTLMTRQSSSHSVDPSPQTGNSEKHHRINLNVDMTKGVGFSLISNALEELLYLTMSGVRLEASLDENTRKFTLKIQKIQIDNQLLGGRPPVMVHPYKSSRSATSTSAGDPQQPAVTIEAVKLPSSNKLYEIYHFLSIDIGRMCLLLEETLILKIIQFVNSGISSQADLSLLDEAKMDIIQSTSSWNISANAAKRFYFDRLKFTIQPMQLSVYTASKSRMDSDLMAIRNSSSLVLIQFERALVSMQAYERHHVFESATFMIEEARKHFTYELKGHAARFLGSVDFLGNPMGLISDLKAGVGSFVRGSPGSLVKHFTHGFSNSAAKFTGSLSTLSGGITMDQEHEEKRRAIRANATNASDHFVAGVQSLTAGIVGGLTSVVTQTVKGATNKGAKGFFTGLGKGLVGTVTKPVTGVLDFASETASFVRDSSISSDMQFQKTRLPRTCHSFQGCVECYSTSRAESQQFLHQINGYLYEEKIYSLFEIKRSGKDSMLFLVTNMQIYLMRNSEPDPDGVALCVNYSELIGANAVLHQNEWNVELTIKMGSKKNRSSPVVYSAASSSVRSSQYFAVLKKPRIICHSESTAKRICEHVNYAKMLASEQSETLPIHDDDMETDRAFDLEV